MNLTRGKASTGPKVGLLNGTKRGQIWCSTYSLHEVKSRVKEGSKTREGPKYERSEDYVL